MSHLTLTSWAHRSYGYAPSYGYHHGFGGGSWIGHMVVSSIIHELIYGVIFRVLSHLSPSEMLLFGGAGDRRALRVEPGSRIPALVGADPRLIRAAGGEGSACAA